MFEKNCHRRTQDWQGITVAKLQENWKMQTVTNLHCWVCEPVRLMAIKFLNNVIVDIFFLNLYHYIMISLLDIDT